jgi:hypothetical protein
MKANCQNFQNYDGTAQWMVDFEIELYSKLATAELNYKNALKAQNITIGEE